jgi:hypothetical protein
LTKDIQMSTSNVPAPLIPGDFSASDGFLSGDLVVKGNVWLGTDLTTTVTILGNLDVSGDIQLDDVIANSVTFTGGVPSIGDIAGFANVVGDGTGGVSGFATGTFTGALSASTATISGAVGVGGLLSGSSATFTSVVTALTLTDGSASMTGGVLSATTGTFSGPISATTASFSGSIGVFGATPPAQATTSVVGGAAAIGVATTATLDSTYGGYTVAQVVAALQTYGLLA